VENRDIGVGLFGMDYEEIHLQIFKGVFYAATAAQRSMKTAVPLGQGETSGELDQATDPPRRCGEGFSSPHPLRRRGISREIHDL